jgi:hypothetical protein
MSLPSDRPLQETKLAAAFVETFVGKPSILETKLAATFVEPVLDGKQNLITQNSLGVIHHPNHVVSSSCRSIAWWEGKEDMP